MDTRLHKGRRVLRETALIAAFGYLVVAMTLTAATWGDPGGRVTGLLADREKFVDLLGWVPFAVTHGLNPLHLTWIDLPRGINLMWETAMPLAGIVVWPVAELAGPVVAYNVGVVATLTLDGLCTFLWLRRRARHHAAAFTGGLLAVAGPYATSRLLGHLNLLMFFTLPLLFIVVENVAASPRSHRVRNGFLIGGLAGMQVLLAEEPLALGMVAIASGVVLGRTLARRRGLPRTRDAAPTALLAALVFAVIAAGPLAYQFAGTDAVHGVIQPPVYVTDLDNLVRPSAVTAVSLGAAPATAHDVRWSGNPVEWDGYIGVPLLGVAAVVVVRRRRDPWLLTVAGTALLALVLSFGSRLHVDGGILAGVPLPWAALGKLPVLDNVLPDRFALIVELGLAAVVCALADEALSWRGAPTVVACAALAATLASLWPAATPAAATTVPRFFTAGGDVERISPGAAALVFPVPYAGGRDPGAASLWQAIAGYRFRVTSALSISADSRGRATFGGSAQPLTCVTRTLQLTGFTRGCPQSGDVLAELRALGVQWVLLGPGTPHAGEVTQYITGLVGARGTPDQGVVTWDLRT